MTTNTVLQLELEFALPTNWKQENTDIVLRDIRAQIAEAFSDMPLVRVKQTGVYKRTTKVWRLYNEDCRYQGSFLSVEEALDEAHEITDILPVRIGKPKNDHRSLLPNEDKNIHDILDQHGEPHPCYLETRTFTADEEMRHPNPEGKCKCEVCITAKAIASQNRPVRI